MDFIIGITKKIATILIVVATVIVHSQSPVDSSKTVRILSFNILHGKTMKGDFNLDVLANIIKESNPDLVALPVVDFKTKSAKGYDLSTELGRRAKFAPLFGIAMSFDDSKYSEGILSKYSFLSSKNHVLVTRVGKEPRAAMEASIVLKSGDTIRFVSTHLDHTEVPIDRNNQVKQLNEIFTNNALPTILAGDLNAEPKSEAMQVLFKEWDPSFPNFEPTFPPNEANIKIDYILFTPSKRWKVLGRKIICDDLVTDHCALFSVLQLIN